MVALPNSISLTVVAIDAAVEAAEDRDFDHVVRGSSIGHPCERHLWYRFRWAHEPEVFDGRKLRLFQTGHEEEARLVAYLALAGVKIEAVDPATGEQWEVTALDGHFAGHLDGIATGILEAPTTPHLLECKTHNARSFAQLLRHGVAISKPEHVAQMQVYMHLKGLTRAFYLAKNKDTDELYGERIRYDAAQGSALLAKAERIRDANAAPARVSDDPSYYLCQAFNCPSYGVCHAGQFALRNCRTCLHSAIGSAGAWYCARFDRVLTIEAQRVGCPNHLYLPSLVPGEQVDADERAETITYRMPDGSVWADGAHREGRAA
ncbi:oxidoreductase [Chelativorans sp.]|uniref:oxidoreductase n=1 Tax=Chelativorans sp. TaxID=2203393 RepID=UPI002811ED7C|nr:oxidoreductase [Chelativorans sp.]